MDKCSTMHVVGWQSTSHALDSTSNCPEEIGEQEVLGHRRLKQIVMRNSVSPPAARSQMC